MGRSVYTGISSDTFVWTGTDIHGNQLPNGIYLIRIDEKAVYRFIKID
jgi:hypothetical protein